MLTRIEKEKGIERLLAAKAREQKRRGKEKRRGKREKEREKEKREVPLRKNERADHVRDSHPFVLSILASIPSHLSADSALSLLTSHCSYLSHLFFFVSSTSLSSL